MSQYLKIQSALMGVFNDARFMLRHYAKGYCPIFPREMSPLPVNRMFFPLKNPNGPENFIADPSRKYELIPGNMYFVPAFLPAQFRLDRELYFLSIQTSLEIFPGVELFSGCSRMLEISVPAEFDPLMEIFDDDEQNLYQNAVKAGSLAFSILTAMLDYYDPEDFWKPLALRRYVDLTDYLKQHGTSQTSVTKLASLKKESRENFTRHFSAETGITPKKLIDRFVIGRCLTLMEQGLSFKEISHLMKFRDEFSFSRYFKRNMGESPRSWRNHQPY